MQFCNYNCNFSQKKGFMQFMQFNAILCTSCNLMQFCAYVAIQWNFAIISAIIVKKKVLG